MKMKKDNSPAREKETRIGGCSSMQTNRSRDKKDESKLHSRVMRPFETEEKKNALQMALTLFRQDKAV